MAETNQQSNGEKPRKKKRGFFRKYFGFFALVAGISSAGKPWEEEDADSDSTPESESKPEKFE